MELDDIRKDIADIKILLQVKKFREDHEKAAAAWSKSLEKHAETWNKEELEDK